MSERKPKFQIGDKVCWTRSNNKREGVIRDGPFRGVSGYEAPPGREFLSCTYLVLFPGDEPDARLLGEDVLQLLTSWEPCPGPHRRVGETVPGEGKWERRR